ncbi:multiprotein-bridging factor 1 family protein [Streptomyces sp. NPDC052236]|uniref:multiprotein-bridging factor 1 family protein n=1 Tax=Streptomyces sp. NPDC052236 TaxID=3365686 RepID=UPI0037D82DB8
MEDLVHSVYVPVRRRQVRRRTGRSGMELTGPADDNDEVEDAADLFRVIGRQVRLLRERAGLTQRELGERLGYSEELIRSLERGRRTPQAEFLDAADELLGAGTVAGGEGGRGEGEVPGAGEAPGVVQGLREGRRRKRPSFATTATTTSLAYSRPKRTPTRSMRCASHFSTTS